MPFGKCAVCLMHLETIMNCSFSKCTQVRVVLHPAVSNLKSLQKSFLSFGFQALPLYIIPSRPHVNYEFWKENKLLEMGKKHNFHSQTHKFCSSPSSPRISSLIGLIFCFHFGWFIPCALVCVVCWPNWPPSHSVWCCPTRTKMLDLISSKVSISP